MAQKRFTITLTESQVDFINQLVDSGEYSKSQIGQEAIRLFIDHIQARAVRETTLSLATQLVSEDAESVDKQLVLNILNKLSESETHK